MACRLVTAWTLLAAALPAVLGVAVSAQVQSQSTDTVAVVSANAEVREDSKLLRSEDAKPHHHHRHHHVHAAASGKIHDEVAKKAAPLKKVHIEVYYETRCPGCIMFINQTLEPLWRNQGLDGVLNVTMVTYGNAMTIPVAHISEGYKFWHPHTTGEGFESVQVCQHGSDECLGNLIQVCAKDVAENSKYMELIFCMSATTIEGYSVEKSSYECMTKAGINHNKVRKCVTGSHGNRLMTEAGKQTAMLKGRLGTPWVMIEGVHADDKLLQNTTDLLRSVCKHVDNAPNPCTPFLHEKPAAAHHAHKHHTPPGDGDDFKVLEDMNLIKVSAKHV